MPFKTKSEFMIESIYHFYLAIYENKTQFHECKTIEIILIKISHIFFEKKKHKEIYFLHLFRH